MAAGMSWSVPPWLDQESLAAPADLTSMHAVNATTAAYHADVAAKHAAGLAQWVQYLQYTLQGLQGKVSELEAWKKGALEDVRKLRDEHKALRRRVLGDEQEPGLPAKSRSQPMMSSSSASEDGASSPGPPGLSLTPAKGSRAESEVDTSPSQDETGITTPLSLPSEVSFMGDADAGPLEGVTVGDAEVDGASCVRAEWHIGNLSAKLKNCMGRNLVSSPFTAAGLEELRLMICADGKDGASKIRQGPRSRRQKELYAKKVTEGPLDGCLKLKAPTSASEQEIEYFLKVGSKRMGPFKHNFAESTVSGCDDFGVDWLKLLEPDLSLTVCVEIVTPAKA
uniref:Uncharacterized protein n=1 Tax=Zooxanthella nutricula TaxID=1333877 RepID=A0A6U6NFL2_9DINO